MSPGPTRAKKKISAVRKQQKKAEVSGSQAGIRRSTRKTKSTKVDQPHHIETDDKNTNLLSPQMFSGEADNISVAHVAEAVKGLNAEIEKVSSLMTNLLSYRRQPGSGSQLGVALKELQEYLGVQLCNELQRRWNKANIEPDPLIAQITLRTGLVNTCSRIIMLSDWDHPFWSKDSTISPIVSNMERAEQVVADTWRKQTQTNTTVSPGETQEVYWTYLRDVLLNLITVVAGSPQNEVTQYNAKLEGIVQRAIELQKIVNKDVTSTGLVTYTVPCNAEFDPSQMEDVKLDSGEIATAPLGRVICTVEMGLRCRKRVNSWSEVRVPVKPKVVLAATPEAPCSITLEKLEITMVELYQLLQKNVEMLSSVEMEAKRRDEDHARDFVTQDQFQQAHAPSQSQSVKRRLRDIGLEGEQTRQPQTFVRKPDSISVVEVAGLVRILNAQIEQLSILVADSLLHTETPSSGKEARIALESLDELDYVGQWLYSNLWCRSERKTEPDHLITQITIQTGLVNACCGIINDSSNSDTVGASEHVQKYLMELLLRLIIATGGSPKTFQSQHSEKVEDITKKVIELHRIVSQEVTSVELTTYTIPSDTSFDPSQMEDTEGGGDIAVPVVCTLEMGLRCRKKVTQAMQNGFQGEQDVTMKAKVVLATTLETEIPT